MTQNNNQLDSPFELIQLGGAVGDVVFVSAPATDAQPNAPVAASSAHGAPPAGAMLQVANAPAAPVVAAPAAAAPVAAPAAAAPVAAPAAAAPVAAPAAAAPVAAPGVAAPVAAPAAGPTAAPAAVAAVAPAPPFGSLNPLENRAGIPLAVVPSADLIYDPSTIVNDASKYYAISRGRCIGVFDKSSTYVRATARVSGPISWCPDTLNAALEWFNEQRAMGMCEIVA
ncbi:uncharacterized protein SCHCODRAFT_02705121 [Schizophyllum commune H4-8]|nr:uncharacterized protein SCHCODRAFT_02705121 [Schizophyllum commune H4-8]KAI5887792.1 hypothetical protein SCHCODRAFT_02705121 [Schizophyllum commune H4-8]